MLNSELIKLLQELPGDADVIVTAEGGQVRMDWYTVELSEDGETIEIGE